MTPYRFLKALSVAVLITTSAPLFAQDQAPITVSPMITDLDAPWGLALLPSGGALVTQRDGVLLHWENGQTREVSGVPKVVANGQGGLLDITLARDFAQTRALFLTYAKPMAGGAGTALAVARLSPDAVRLENLREIFEMSAGSSAGRHFGSRVVEAQDGTLFVTIGDRGDRPLAQDRSRHNGSIVRVNRDGTVPADNPFVGQSGILPEIWSFGHRNPQGANLDAEGQLWTSEHGARGGDEVNRIKKGANFGWPVISYGRHYTGGKIGEGSAKEGMEQPAYYWDPSIAPSGLIVYQGDMFPEWRGDMFIGSLKFDYISRLDITGTTAREVQKIESPETERVRDLVQAADGSIWFISVGNDTVYRMARP